MSNEPTGQILGTYLLSNGSGRWFNGSNWEAYQTNAARFEGSLIDARQHASWLTREAKQRVFIHWV